MKVKEEQRIEKLAFQQAENARKQLEQEKDAAIRRIDLEKREQQRIQFREMQNKLRAEQSKIKTEQKEFKIKMAKEQAEQAI